MLDVVGDVCGIHAQMAASAELSLGLRVDGITRSDVNTALWRERSLVKTYGLRGTLHLLPAREFSLWTAALRAKVPPREPSRAELDGLPLDRRDELIQAICAALEGRERTRDDLEADIARRVGAWATEAALPAFGGRWPRWQLGLHQAAQQGLIVAGPPRGNRVTYVRTEDWLGTLEPVDGQTALREVCRRFLAAYGPATHVEFARWFYTRASAARELMASLDLESVEVEGWRAWLPRASADGLGERVDGLDERVDGRVENLDEATLHLVPQFDCYVVGGYPRDRLIPEAAPAPLKRGTAAPFAVVLIGGTVGGLWQRQRHGAHLDVRIDMFKHASASQRQAAERQAARVAAILGLPPSVSFGSVEPRAHL